MLGELREQVEGKYQHKSYAYRAQRLEEFDRFLRRMRPGNLVLTTAGGRIYLGEVASAPYFASSPDGLSKSAAERRLGRVTAAYRGRLA